MADLSLLLDQTSRTFALAIPLLPEPLRQQVTVAYLLFRTADTFEDATHWSFPERIQALRNFGQTLDENDLDRATQLTIEWHQTPPLEHEGYLKLVQAFPELIVATHELSEGARDTIHWHTLRTVEAMLEFVRHNTPEGELRLGNLDELRGYCYAVAGIVGEMLTELFLREYASLANVADRLRERSVRFGEGLQLINMLKDARADIREKRFFLPPNVLLSDVISIARSDLLASQEYIDFLREGNAPAGVVRFAALPVLLAEATLAEVEAHGSGAKISRADVARIGLHIHNAVASGESIWSMARGTP